MSAFIIATLCTLQMVTQQCSAVLAVDLPGFDSDENTYPSGHENDEAIQTEPEIEYQQIEHKKYPPIRVRKTSLANDLRRHWTANPTASVRSRPVLRQSMPNHGDENLKNKIATLVQQTLHDTDLKVKSVKYKEEEEPLYKVGVVLSLIKKSRETMNELFNVAVKHRDAWKALEQLKVFELIVHTNVDTTNYVRQLVELYMQITGTSDGGDPRNIFSDLLQYHESRLNNKSLED